MLSQSTYETHDIARPFLWRNAAIFCVFLSLHLLGITASATAADEKSLTFNIPALPLSRAITEFAEQTGLQIVVDARVVHGLKSPQVIGVFEPHAALFRLLAGTGLTLRVLAPGTVGLVAGAPSSAVADC